MEWLLENYSSMIEFWISEKSERGRTSELLVGHSTINMRIEIYWIPFLH